MSDEGMMVPLSQPDESANPGNGGGARRNNRRRRNRNRNGNQSKSRSPSRDSTDGDSDVNHHQQRQNRHGQNHHGNKKSMSPTRQTNKSRSPTRRQGGNKSRSPTRCRGKGQKPRKPATEMTVIVNRCDLWDSAAHFQPEENHHPHHPPPDIEVAPYRFLKPFVVDGKAVAMPPLPQHAVTVARVPHSFQKFKMPNSGQGHCDVIDTSIPNPHDPNVVHDKYWAQRRRLFSRFDQGIRLDGEGWYSVTPEIIADHVANRVADLANLNPNHDGKGIVILDAFCGCGGNSIAFGKIPSNLISKVVCVDTDRTKLQKAAHNASLYNIPRDKLIFVECNSAFILRYCYQGGEFILDKPTSEMPQHMPAPVHSTNYAGYQLGGLDMLPRRIDAVFMDPPWGGVDYEVLGKNGYDLQRNMKIQVSPPIEDDYEGDGDGVGDDFFDSFSTSQTSSKMSQKARKANFNKKTEGEYIDGMELLRVAAGACSSHLVVYDLPRNTSKTSLGKCALGAGYRGNLKLEEHYLNGRLKTVTAYMGADYSDMINNLHGPPSENLEFTPSVDSEP